MKNLPLQQKKCLVLLCQGLTYKEIAQKLDLSPRTVEFYLKILREYFKVESSRELMVLIYRKSSKDLEQIEIDLQLNTTHLFTAFSESRNH